MTMRFFMKIKVTEEAHSRQLIFGNYIIIFELWNDLGPEAEPATAAETKYRYPSREVVDSSV
jgi:hypothetical protein